MNKLPNVQVKFKLITHEIKNIISISNKRKIIASMKIWFELIVDIKPIECVPNS